MRLILITILSLTTLRGVAQNHWVGVTGGVSLTHITSSNFVASTAGQYQATGGLTYEYLSQRRLWQGQLSVGADLVYAPRGFSTEIKSIASERVTTQYDYDYLSVPLKVGWSEFNTEQAAFGFAKVGFIKLGIVPSWLVSAQTTVPTIVAGSVTIPARAEDVTGRASGIDLAGLVELGVGGNVVGELWWIVSATYQHSITSITNDRYFEGASIRHHNIGVNVAMKHLLNNEADY